MFPERYIVHDRAYRIGIIESINKLVGYSILNNHRGEISILVTRCLSNSYSYLLHLISTVP